MIYLIVLLFILYGFKKYDCNFRRGDITKNLHYFICFILIFIASFRYNIGGDTKNYVDGFNQMSKLENLTLYDFEYSRYQPGWIIFVSTIKTVWDNFVAQQIIEALIINLIIFRFIRKYSSFVFLVTLVYFLLNYFEYNTEIMREGLCVAIGLLAYELLDKNRYVYAILLIALAFQIHISALVLCLMPLISKIRISNNRLFISIIVISILPSLYMAIPNLSIYVGYLFGETEDWMKDSYLQQSYSETLNSNYYIVHVFKYVVVPSAIIYLLNKLGEIKFTGLVYAYSVLQALSMISYAFYRFANYFAPFYWIAVSICLMHYAMERTRSKLAFLVLFMICFLYLYQSVQLRYDSERNIYFYERYIPYVSVFEGKCY